MDHQLPVLVVLVVILFCRLERVRVLVARQPDCHISKICVAADAYWTSAEARVFLYHPLLSKGMGRILPFPYLGRRVDRMFPFPYLGRRVKRMLPVLGFVPCRLGLWNGVVIWEEADRRDRPVGPHCLLPA